MANVGEKIVIEGKGWSRAQGRVVGLGAGPGYLHLQLETDATYRLGEEPRQMFKPGQIVEISGEALAGLVDDTPPSPPPAVRRAAHYRDPDYGDAHLAAIITEVIPAAEIPEVTLVALTVFPPDEPPYTAVNVEQGDEARQWHWPERV